MARQRRRRRRRQLENKYVVRRILVLLVPIALIFAIVLFINREPKVEQTDADPAQSQPTGSQEGSEPTTAEPTEPTTAAPEPEPVPWNLLLVNSQNPIPDGFEDALELEYVTGEFRVDRRIIESYTRMSNKAKGDGVDLMICSAYRSVARQTELFEGRRSENLAKGMGEEEALAAALQYTNRPGTSEHHTGLAIDIVTPTYQNLDEGYAETAAAKWLVENAAEFGFILRYPKGKENYTQVDFEPWHYRYVGEEHAEIIMREGYCLEEFFFIELKQQIDEQSKVQDETEPTDDSGGASNDEPQD